MFIGSNLKGFFTPIRSALMLNFAQLFEAQSEIFAYFCHVVKVYAVCGRGEKNKKALTYDQGFSLDCEIAKYPTTAMPRAIIIPFPDELSNLFFRASN